MRVSEIASEFKTTETAVLEKLRSLKLKAKDGEQELNRAVVIVLRSELLKDLKIQSQSRQQTRESSLRRVPPLLSAEEKKAALEKEEAAKEAKAPESRRSRKSKDASVAPAKAVEVASEVNTPEDAVPAQPLKEIKVVVPSKEVVPPPEKLVEKTPVVVVPPVEEKVKSSAPSVDAPFVPLKPLVKKKRRTFDKGRETGHELSGKGDQPADRPDPVNEPPPSAEDVSAGVDVEGLPSLEIKMPISVKDFALRLQQKASAVLKKLLDMGVFTNINQNLGEDIVRKVAREFGYNITKVKTQEELLIEDNRDEIENPELLMTRAPVVTFMGHVDHGKTSLLDRIRKSRVADQEHGGITQHIGAYSVKVPRGRITFLDTPGHEAFTAMRARGAHITDLVVLVVAADEGIMPQTEEAIDHARAANVPILVALNKIDRRNADPDRVKKQLAEHGLNSEDWGGKTVVVGVSAVTGEGVDQLLEMILLESEMLELKANSNATASGIVVEAHLSRGQGAMATFIVQRGTLKLNDIVVVGPFYGKAKAMFDDFERPIQSAGPSMPVEILGLPGVPEAGERFYVVPDERKAREITQARQEQLKNDRLSSSRRMTLEDLYSHIKEGSVRELSVIVKADVQGSLEAIKDSLEKIPSEEVKVRFIHVGVGDVNNSDVILAAASNAIILAFHVGVDPRAAQELEKQQVDLRTYRIIYDAVNDVRKALEGLLEPKTRRKFVARVEIRQVFKLSRSGIIAGCFVTKGKVNRKVTVEVVRNGQIVHSGSIGSLKRFKDDVKEVAEGYECGISVQGFDQIEPGDILEAFEVERIARTLD